MKRIVLLWDNVDNGLKNEGEGCLWNSMQSLSSEIVILCGTRKEEKFCCEHNLRNIFIEMANDVESAWKQGKRLFQQLFLDDFDEIIIIDINMVGPFYPINLMFIELQEETIDFWGLVRNEEMYTRKHVRVPAHIDPRFIVLKKSSHSFFCSQRFYSILFNDLDKELPLEIAFMHSLEKWGFIGKAYCDTTLYGNARKCYNFISYEGKSYELVKDKGCPFVPISIFGEKNFLSDDGDDARKLLEYLVRCLNFSQDYLWQKLLGYFDVSDIYQTLHLDYVLDEKHTDFEVIDKKVAVIIHVYYEDLLEKVAHYVKNVPEWMDCYLTTSLDKNIKKIHEIFGLMQITNYKVLKVENRGRDCSALLIGCREIAMQYDYLCFVHDKKTSGNNGACTIGETFMDSLFENLLGSEAYIYNALELFENNNKLGLVAPPIPLQGPYFCLKDNAWTNCFDETLKLLERMNLNVMISKEKSPFILSTSFWCRTKALEPIWKYKFCYEDFCEEPLPEDGTISHAVERALPYIAQNQGFYSAVIMTAEKASLQISNLNYQLMGTVRRLRDNYSISSYDRFDKFDLRAFLKFCKSYERIYIYGAGIYGRKCAQILENNSICCQGFIVTNKGALDKVFGYHIFDYNDFLKREKANMEKVGILIAVSVHYEEEICELLQQQKIYNYYIV